MHGAEMYIAVLTSGQKCRDSRGTAGRLRDFRPAPRCHCNQLSQKAWLFNFL